MFLLYFLAIQVNPVGRSVSVGCSMDSDSVGGRPALWSTPACSITPLKRPRLEHTPSSESSGPVEPQDSSYAPDVTEEEHVEDQR